MVGLKITLKFILELLNLDILDKFEEDFTLSNSGDIFKDC